MTPAGGAILLGMAYGLAMFIGLPEDLAGLTGIYYCCTYLGMMFPALLTFLGGVFTYPQMLGFRVLMASAGVAWEARAA
ncbi:hypothetical protein ACUY2R_05980 [Corynebacterium mastitidis]